MKNTLLLIIASSSISLMAMNAQKQIIPLATPSAYSASMDTEDTPHIISSPQIAKIAVSSHTPNNTKPINTAPSVKQMEQSLSTSQQSSPQKNCFESCCECCGACCICTGECCKRATCATAEIIGVVISCALLPITIPCNICYKWCCD